jgi:anti-sigma regulatory factor (Ser/Thr protein kinase)
MAHRASHLSDAMGMDLPFAAESARIARQRLSEWLDHVGRDNQRDDARLVISELVGNAVRHARPLSDGTMRVSWNQTDSGIDISVTDGGALTTPERVDAGVSDLAGRGLAIVESLACRWWVESTRSRTTVHAVLRLS